MGAFSLHVFDNACTRASESAEKGKIRSLFMHMRWCLRQERARMDLAARGKQEPFGGKEGEAGADGDKTPRNRCKTLLCVFEGSAIGFIDA